MAITQEKLQEVENTLKSTLNPVFAMAGVANPLVAAVMFGVGMIFRFVKIGVQVRKQLEENRQALDEAVRAEGIFRMPVNVSLNFSVILNFFLHECELLYPVAYKQLEPERKILLDKTNPKWKEAFETLELAYRILPEVYLDKKFDDNPMLDDLFGKWLDPGNPDFGSLVRELRLFLSKDKLSIPDLKEMLPSFTRQRLEDIGIDMESITEDQLNQINEQIGSVVWEAVSGEDSALAATLDFAIEKRSEAIDNQIAELEAKRDELSNLPSSRRDNSHDKQAEQVDKRMEELKTLKERISDSV